MLFAILFATPCADGFADLAERALQRLLERFPGGAMFFKVVLKHVSEYGRDKLKRLMKSNRFGSVSDELHYTHEAISRSRQLSQEHSPSQT